MQLEFRLHAASNIHKNLKNYDEKDSFISITIHMFNRSILHQTSENIKFH